MNRLLQQKMQKSNIFTNTISPQLVAQGGYMNTEKIIIFQMIYYSSLSVLKDIYFSVFIKPHGSLMVDSILLTELIF